MSTSASAAVKPAFGDGASGQTLLGVLEAGVDEGEFTTALFSTGITSCGHREEQEQALQPHTSQKKSFFFFSHFWGKSPLFPLLRFLEVERLFNQSSANTCARRLYVPRAHPNALRRAPRLP